MDSLASCTEAKVSDGGNCAVVMVSSGSNCVRVMVSIGSSHIEATANSHVMMAPQAPCKCTT